MGGDGGEDGGRAAEHGGRVGGRVAEDGGDSLVHAKSWRCYGSTSAT
jgi:hypothetical protein